MGMDDAGLPAQRTHLFLLRMWPEEVGREQIDWRGSVQHVISGEVRYFREWRTLEAFVDGLLEGSGTEEAHEL
jgi:hypothetical protein